MTTPPFSPPLHVVLQAIQYDFKLTDEQLAALPPLEEVELISQTDSGKIQHADVKTYNYHPFKLFIGQHKNDPFHAYLMRTGARKQYKIELCSVDTEKDIDYPPMDAQWFGTVDNLAYPFNAFLGAARFTAVVKWYFLLAFRSGEFDEDPGFNVTESWRKELQGACDELTVAPQRERQREQQKEQKDRIKDLEKKAGMLRREIAKKKESEATVEQRANGLQQIRAMLSQPKTQDKIGQHRRKTRQSDEPTRAFQDDNELDVQRNKESTNRRASLPPPRHAGMNEVRVFSPGAGQWPLYPASSAYVPDSREATPLLHEQFKQRRWRPEIVYSRPYVPLARIRKEPTRFISNESNTDEYIEEGTPIDGEAITKKGRFIKAGIVPVDERPTQRRKDERATNDETLDRMNDRLADHGGFVPTQENFEEWKKSFLSKSVEPASERPARRRKSEHAAEDDKLEPVDGSTEGNKADERTTRMSWTEEVKQLTPTGEDGKEQEKMKEEEVEAGDSTRAERERKWMQLYHKRVGMLQQMRELEDEMSVADRLDLFDKVK